MNALKQYLWALAISVLLTAFAVQTIASLRQKSVTVDEITYITAGYYHLRAGDFHYNSTNPPLMKIVAALPLLILDPLLPATPEGVRDWGAIDDWRYAREFLFNNRTDADAILFAARLPIVLIGIAVGLGVYFWSSTLYGRWGGVTSLFLYVFSPTVLAHSRLATQDMGLSAAVIATTFFVWRYTEKPRLTMLVLAGAGLGLGVAIKTTMLFTLPAFGLYVLMRMAKSTTFAVHHTLPFVNSVPTSFPRLRQFISLSWAGAALGVVMVFSINLTYAFQGTFESIGTKMQSASLVRAEGISNGRVARLAAAVESIPVLLPSAYLDGLAYQKRLGGNASRVFFAGKIYEQGAWYLIFMTVLLKTTLPALLLAGSAIGALLWRGAREHVEWLLLFVVVAYLLAFSFMSGFAGNVRYVLPIYPLIFILVGRLVAVTQKARAFNIVLAILAAGHASSSLATYPHYLAYFNESIGGPSNGYKYLAESSLDWGQDLKGLKQYMEKRNISRIRLGYFGSADARYYDIDYDYLPSVGLTPKKSGQKWWYEMQPQDDSTLELQPGLVAVSANLLSGPQWIGPLFGNTYAQLRDAEPIDSVGYSILIFDVP